VVIRFRQVSGGAIQIAVTIGSAPNERRRIMADIRGAFDLIFEKQIAFFRGKINLPTARWDDVWKSGHDRAFVVAGAMQADLLDDLRKAVEQGITAGTGIDEFRSKFREIVKNRGWHGWTGEGTEKGEAWRTRVIFETNLRTSYAAGRHAQLTDPDLLSRRPFWQYIHSDNVRHPRPHHKAWGDSNLTLRYDDPFWQTHFPPNGWGCGCTVKAVRAPVDGAATAPPEGWDSINPKTGTPTGIDKGWDYAPGATRADELREMAAEKAAKLPEPLRSDLIEAVSTLPDAVPLPVTVDDYISVGRKIVDSLPVDPVQAQEQLMARLASEVGVGRACMVIETNKGAKLLKDAAKKFPASWVEKADNVGLLHARLRSNSRGFHFTVPKNYPIGVATNLPIYGRIYPSRGDGYILISGLRHVEQFSCAVHEYSHRLQDAFPDLQKLFTDLHRKRTQGDPVIKLRSLRPDHGYKSDELTREDQYIDPYWGKEYSGEPREVLTMAMQTVIAGNNFSYLYNDDREMLEFITGILFNWKP
jgi:hypothetical protein